MSFLDRFAEIDRLFADLLALPKAERSAFLSDLQDDDLRHHLAGLLEELDATAVVDAQAADLLTELPMISTDLAVVAVQQTVGPYRLVRELGHGGMGTVFLAERADGTFEQQVALKVVRHVASDALRRRFQYERQVLAKLQHPNIARLVDGGTTPEGLPWFAMEYIDGQPIDAYCDAHALSIDDRLLLFGDVCEAVQYAHQHLVVHRDLKPSNILVTNDGRVKLLDFGIAKLLAEDEQLHATVTQTGMHLMTPAYASPEQIAGTSMTTTSDVYALGVLLYELLTGQRPFDLAGHARRAMEDLVLHAEPKRPSTVIGETTGTADGATRATTRSTAPQRLRQRLAGDLDTICLKALRKEPEQRYASAEQLGADLRAHLAGMPVSAQQPTLSYRLGKFARRNRATLATAAAVLLLVTSLVGFYTYRLGLERDRATLEADKATQIKDFVVDLFDAADPDRPEPATARDLLDEGTARIATELTEQPEIRAEMLTVMGDLNHKLGDYDQAEALLEDALATRRALHGEQHPLVATSLYELAINRRYQGRYTDADSLHRLALALRRSLLPDNHRDLMHSTNELGIVAWRLGDYAEAEAMHRETLERRRMRSNTDPLALATSLNNLGLALTYQDRPAEAKPLYEEALAIRRAEQGPEHSEVARLLNNLALANSWEGDDPAAEKNYRAALDIRLKRFGDEHPLVASSQLNLAVALANQYKDDEAEPLYRSSWTMRRKLLGEAHNLTLVSQTRLADFLIFLKQYAEAASLMRDALTYQRDKLGPDHPDVIYSTERLGKILLDEGSNLEAAERYLREALGLYEQHNGKEQDRYTRTLASIAMIHRARGDVEAAERLFAEALDLWTRINGGQSNRLLYTLQFGHLLHDGGRYTEAETQFTNAVAIGSDTFGAEHWRTAEAQSALGSCLTKQGRYAEAEAVLTASHVILAAAERTAETETARQRLVDLYTAWGKPQNAATWQ
ncbi:MAG: serine/threonine-protein kinase [Bacteroidota bacterium]